MVFVHVAVGNCTSDQFSCHGGGCILSSKKCDGTSDCEDGSDESNCGELIAWLGTIQKQHSIWF